MTELQPEIDFGQELNTLEKKQEYEIIDADKNLGTEKCLVIYAPGTINPDIFFDQPDQKWVLKKGDETYYAVKFPGKKQELYTFYEIKQVFDEFEKKEFGL